MSGVPAQLLAPEAQGPSTDQLRAVLARALRRIRPRTRITGIERVPAAYGSSWWLEDLTLHLDDGSRMRLVFKDLSREARGSGARRVKPAFVTDPTREAWVYRTLLRGTGNGAPKLRAAVNDPAQGRHWLFLERVEGVPLAEVGDRRVWCRVAHWLGRFHQAAKVPGARSVPLLRHDREYHRVWITRALAAAKEETHSRDPSLRGRALDEVARLRAIAPLHERAVGEALATGETLIHGEFYPSNIVVDVRGATCRVHPLDWEMAALGPPLLDLAALLTGPWGPDDRHAMESAYCDGALSAGTATSPLDQFRRRLAACRMLLAVQWQGWARGWDPPADHRNDWLEEAERCAEELRA